MRPRPPLRIGPADSSRQLVLKLKTNIATRRALKSLATDTTPPVMGAGPEGGPLGQLLAGDLLESIEPLFPSPESRRAAAVERMVLALEDQQDQPELAGLHIARFRSAKEAHDACALLAHDKWIDYVHVIPERFPCARKVLKSRRQPFLDPLLNRQWGLTAIQLPQAQAASGFQEAHDLIVAVIDTGVDANHPDLQGIFLETRSFTSGPLADTKGHGTHVTGILAAIRNNQVGISGVCQSRKILSLKALGPYDGPGYYRALRHATDNQARVLNLSIGGTYDPTEELLIKRAISRGVVVVAAMGNEYEQGNPLSYPAALNDVLAVGASTEVDTRAFFSNTGVHIDLLAPGTNILSTTPTYPSELASTTHYEAWAGTSMATPFVAATVALLLTKKPNASLQQITRALHQGADPVTGQTGFSQEYGHGRLNVRKTLALVR